jgi:hypothetical protein
MGNAAPKEDRILRAKSAWRRARRLKSTSKVTERTRNDKQDS